MFNSKRVDIYHHSAKNPKPSGFMSMLKGIGCVYASPFIAGKYLFDFLNDNSDPQIISAVEEVEATIDRVNSMDHNRSLIEAINGKYGEQAKQNALKGIYPTPDDQYSAQLRDRKTEITDRIAQLERQKALRDEIVRLETIEEKLVKDTLA